MLNINDIGADAMIHARDHQTPYLFDPWDYLGPKRKMLSPATAESRARATICSFSKTLSFSCCNRDAIRGFNVFIKIID